MKKLLFTLVSVAVLAAACAPAAANDVFEAGQVEMRPGQTLDDVQSGSTMTFVEILQDSRCPADATCVTSGFVQVLLEIHEGDRIRHETLTLGDMQEGDTNWTHVGEFTVTLLEVNPYPLASQPVDYADYTITLDLYAE